jgi:hypothetical protein
VDGGLPADVMKNIAWQNPALRDRMNRFGLFNPETDKVWATMHRLLGQPTCDVIRYVLKSQTVEKSWNEAVVAYKANGEGGNL